MLGRLGVMLRAVLVTAMLSSLVVMPPAASAAPGGLLWERSVAPGVRPYDVAVDDDGSYFVSCPGPWGGPSTVEKFAADGTHLWTYDVTANGGGWADHLDLDATGVYVTTGSAGTVIKLDKATGNLIWTASGFPGPAGPTKDVAVYDGVLHVTRFSYADSWFTLDAATGAYIALMPRGAAYVAVDATGIYVWSTDMVLRRLDSGMSVIWETNDVPGGGMELGGDGYLYMGDGDGEVVRKIDIDDGSVAATIERQEYSSGVDIHDGVLYVTIEFGGPDGSGTVRAFAEPWPDYTLPEGVTGLESPSHPDQDTWYADNMPSFIWDYSPSKFYSYSIDQDPDGEPDLTAVAPRCSWGATIARPVRQR